MENRDPARPGPGPATRLLHPDAGTFAWGATLPPVFQTSAFCRETAEEMEAQFAGKAPGFLYTRLGNPTVAAFEAAMCEAEGGVTAAACASGSAAIAVTLMNLLSAGDEIVSASGVYGGTLDLFRDLAPFGVRVKYVDRLTEETLAAAIGERTKAVFAEAVSNPGLRVLDVATAAKAAHGRGVPLIVDATTVTPALLRPLEYGADIVIHSSSKYINGNGSAISGVIVDGCAFPWNADRFPALGEYLRYGKGAFSARLKNAVWRDIGACLSPVNAFLNLTGLETLCLRMERISENALRLARFLEEKGVPARYPGLASHPDHAIAARQMTGGMAGGVITLRTGSRGAAFRLLNALKYAKLVSNIGDTKTLAIHPASTIFAHASPEQKRSAGVYDDLVRVSVGLENAEDLIADFENALKAV